MKIWDLNEFDPSLYASGNTGCATDSCASLIVAIVNIALCVRVSARVRARVRIYLIFLFCLIGWIQL